jgi:NitT/TauT family transport system ATP-binding protein
MEGNLTMRGVWKALGATQILSDVSAEFPEGQTTCILGPSGCGKTTLLRLIAQLIEPDSGSITGLHGHRISFVFQEDRLLPWKTVAENISLVLKHTVDRDALERSVRDHLVLVQMDDYGSHYPHQLSGGMRQRVAFARAFSYPSSIILLDEPFKGLDVPLKRQLMDNVEQLLRQDKRTAIYVTHEPEEAVFFGDQILIMSDKPARIAEAIVCDRSAYTEDSMARMVQLVNDKLPRARPV